MATAEGEPGIRWETWKAWAALSTCEFAIILILSAGLAHFAALQGVTQEGEDSWLENGRLTSLERANQSLQVVAKRWESCRNRTRMLEANTSSLTFQMAQLNSRLRLKELENQVLEDELAVLKNWTQGLQDLNNRQKEIIGHFQHQQKMLPGAGNRVHLPFGLVSVLLTRTTILQA